MTLDRAHFHIARLVLETVTPLSIGQSGDGLFDNKIVRDANGLPAIPGSSFAGVLRHLVTAKFTEDAADRLFGIGGNYERNEKADQKRRETEGPPSKKETGAHGRPPEPPFGASRVHVSWGCLHDSGDRPVEGLVHGEDGWQSDPLLRDARGLVPLRRDHVRLDHRGSAVDQGQYERVCLRAGHRFSIELSLWSQFRDHSSWNQLINALADPAFRLGGRTRAGLGAVRLVRMHHRGFDLRDEDDYQAYLDLSPSLGDVTDLVACNPQKAAEPLTATICLEPEDYFRFGQGDQALGEDQAHPPKLLPVTEEVVEWQDDGRGRHRGMRGRRRLLIPASAVKGALRHRVAYHHRVLSEDFVTAPADASFEAEKDKAVQQLFGYILDAEREESADSSQAGRLILDDVYAEPGPSTVVPHNGIDRFTGGVRAHVLYSEQVTRTRAPLALRLRVLEPEAIAARKARQALVLALDDLVSGRLALGAGGARGLGFFTGRVSWSDGGVWIEGGEA